MMSIIMKHKILKVFLYLSADFQFFNHPSPKALNMSQKWQFLSFKPISSAILLP